MKIAATARFIALTVAWLAVAEAGLRRYVPNDFFWEEVTRSRGAIRALFIGTSRTAAAIDEDAFRASLPDSRVTVVNAGRGFVTPVEFFLALRNTLRDRPETLRDTVLFIEAPAGMAEPQSWSDSWAHPDQPAVMTPLLRPGDIAHYWRTPHRFEDKLHVSASYLFRPSALVTRREAIGGRLFGKIHLLLQSRLESVLLGRGPQAAPADLTAAGGIRTDVEGVLLARRVAEDYARASTADQRAINWQDTVTADVIQLARSHHVTVLFFTPPLHSLHRAIYETPRRRLDRQTFTAFAVENSTPILTPDFPTADEDFPDIWHLKRSLAAGYTRALARSFLDRNLR